MRPTVPEQHPAVVLRSHFRQLAALLAVAIVVIVALTAAVVVLAADHGTAARATSAGTAEAWSRLRIGR